MRRKTKPGIDPELAAKGVIIFIIAVCAYVFCYTVGYVFNAIF